MARHATVVLGFICLLLATAGTRADETVRVGALKFGTVNWELDTIAANGFDKAAGVTMQVTYFAGEDASAIAFQAGDVDVIVSDWLDGRNEGWIFVVSWSAMACRPVLALLPHYSGIPAKRGRLT